MVVFGIPAIRALPLAESGTFELLFILVVPMATATAATMVELWVESLPSQVGGDLANELLLRQGSKTQQLSL